MIKDDLTKHFPYRLREAMIGAGYDSPRSLSGVDLQKLQEITGHSVQICRRYLKGDALPEIHKIIKIAQELNVSPSWLLFGEANCRRAMSSEYITIHQSLLYYIYQEICKLDVDKNDEELPEFLLSLTKDISEITANEIQLKRIVDLALSPIKQIQKRKTAS